MALPKYMGTTALRGIRATRDTQSPMLKARFLHLTILVAQPGIKSQTSPPCLTTRMLQIVLSLLYGCFKS